MNPARFFHVFLTAIWILTACTSAPTRGAVLTTPLPGTAPVGEIQQLTVMTHDSFSASKSLIAEFEKEHQAKVNFLKAGETGAALNKAILTRQNPLADVFYGVDNTFLSRALESDIFEPYPSPNLKDIPGIYRLDPKDRALPVDFGDVCINYDKAYFKEKNLPVPQKLEDLTRKEYAGQLVVENPATSSPGLAFLLATVAQFGPDRYLDYWKQLKANQVVVAAGWETAYYTHFSGSSGRGAQSMVVSYASSPAAEVIFSKTPLNDSPTGSILSPGTCFRQIEFVGILVGTRNRQMAQKFVDFMLSIPFQEDMPEQMFVYPVHPDAKLPEYFQKYARIAEKPANLDASEISKNRELWIKNWADTVLR